MLPDNIITRMFVWFLSFIAASISPLSAFYWIQLTINIIFRSINTADIHWVAVQLMSPVHGDSIFTAIVRSLFPKDEGSLLNPWMTIILWTIHIWTFCEVLFWLHFRLGLSRNFQTAQQDYDLDNSEDRDSFRIPIRSRRHELMLTIIKDVQQNVDEWVGHWFLDKKTKHPIGPKRAHEVKSDNIKVLHSLIP